MNEVYPWYESTVKMYFKEYRVMCYTPVFFYLKKKK